MGVSITDLDTVRPDQHTRSHHRGPVPPDQDQGGGLVFCGEDVALIRRDRPGSIHYTPPGGNVEHGEDLEAALARELAEELDLDIGQAAGGTTSCGSSTSASPALSRPHRHRLLLMGVSLIATIRFPSFACGGDSRPGRGGRPPRGGNNASKGRHVE
ncbi:NUDIX hydrolase [Streptomyces sp. V2I9]|uniref:NUDIX hydrolase n=1 Tax=Streptomyces sp. V2I9 TaxID=3042304 RepID=UPI0027D8B309|nr:NUDIX domain-containing protein [Streptomyces sp. V2I9]